MWASHRRWPSMLAIQTLEPRSLVPQPRSLARAAPAKHRCPFDRPRQDHQSRRERSARCGSRESGHDTDAKCRPGFAPAQLRIEPRCRQGSEMRMVRPECHESKRVAMIVRAHLNRISSTIPLGNVAKNRGAQFSWPHLALAHSCLYPESSRFLGPSKRRRSPPIFRTVRSIRRVLERPQTGRWPQARPGKSARLKARTTSELLPRLETH